MKKLTFVPVIFGLIVITGCSIAELLTPQQFSMDNSSHIYLSNYIFGKWLVDSKTTIISNQVTNVTYYDTNSSFYIMMEFTQDKVWTILTVTNGVIYTNFHDTVVFDTNYALFSYDFGIVTDINGSLTNIFSNIGKYVMQADSGNFYTTNSNVISVFRQYNYGSSLYFITMTNDPCTEWMSMYYDYLGIFGSKYYFNFSTCYPDMSLETSDFSLKRL